MNLAIRKYLTPIGLTVVVLAVAIGWLRETGHLGLNLYKAESGEDISSASVQGGMHNGNQPNRVLTSPKIVLQSSVDPALWTILEGEISGVVTRPGTRLIVEKLDIDGSYGMPFYKTGKCEYIIDLVDGVDSIPAGALNGTGDSGREVRLKGTIDLKVNGLCSRREYRKLLAEKIAPLIRTEAGHFTDPL